MAKSNNHLVIMAGGVGSRFWPLSTPERPKQFIDITGVGKTMLQQTYERFEGLFPLENIWIVTGKQYASIVAEQLPQVSAERVLLEPCQRNTAPCIAYASWRIKMIDPKANVVVTPCDHSVMDINEFQRIIHSCLKFTDGTDAAVTIGIKPTRPETGYGYIEADLTSSSPRNKEIFRIDSFREKPDVATAKRYVSHKNYFWNAGIFIWSVSTVVNAFRVYSPQIGKIFESLAKYYGTPYEQEQIDLHYPKCENISVDYAIMEKVEESFVCPADFGWADIGSWHSLLTEGKRDLYGNCSVGKGIRLYDTRDCVVHAPNEEKVVVQGLDGFVVAHNGNTLLICKLDDDQQVKQLSAIE